MNVLKVVLLPFFLISNMYFSQNFTEYYYKINQAKEDYSNDNFKFALKNYQEAFLLNFPFPDDVFEAINCSIKLKDDKATKKLIKLLVLSGYKSENTLPIFLIKQKKYIEYKTSNDFYIPEYKDYYVWANRKYRKIYLQKVVPEIDNKLEFFKTTEYFITSVREELNDDVQTILWEKTADLFINLYYSNSDITRGQSDSWNDDKFTLNLIHSAIALVGKKEKLEIFLSILERMVLKGNLYPYQYAIIVDEIEHKQGKPSIYGTKIETRSFNGDIESFKSSPKKISDIINIDYVDERRKKIFLPPLWVSAKRFHLELPQNYKKE